VVNAKFRRRATAALAATLLLPFATSMVAGCSVRIGPPAAVPAKGANETTRAARAARETAPRLARTTGRLLREDGTELYYEVAGSGPALVLIHGLGGNHAVWYRQFPILAREYRVVAFSQRGFTPSGGARDSYAPKMLAADLRALLDHLDIDRAHLVGQSMGGWTALTFALDSPERVRSLVLADTLAGISDPAIEAHTAAMIDRARSLSAEPAPLASHPALDPAFASAHPEEAWLYQTLASFGAPDPGRIAAQLGHARADGDRLAANRVPTLFIVGERDRIFTPEIVDHASSLLAESRVVRIVGAGHSPYFETPARWRRTLRSFLNRRETRRHRQRSSGTP
jgi:3-oxoadipate enol-lactonase